MNQSLWQVIGFVVLAVIVLGTGIGALGAPATLAGAF